MKMNYEEKRVFNKELVALGLPLALQALLQALVGASDALMLGRLTQDAIAAVSLANQVSFILSLFTGAIIGAISVLMAQYIGKGDNDNARLFFNMSIRIVTFISILFTFVTFFWSETLMSFFTNETELIRIGSEYLRIVSFSYIFSSISQCYLMVMKLQERVKLSVIISCVVVCVDMIADFFLIYGFMGIPKLGANGSAYSTIVVEIIALIWVVLDSNKANNLKPDFSRFFYFSKKYEKDLWTIAVGMLASYLSWGLSMSMHSFIMGHLGTEAVAAASITSVVQQLIRCVVQGISIGSGIMIGKLLGANQLEQAKKYGDRFWYISFISGLISIGLLVLTGPFVVIFYVLDSVAKAYLVKMLVFTAFYEFACAFNTIIVCGVFPAGGDAKYDAISVFFATWCIALPLACIGSFAFHWPVMVVYIVMCIDEIIKVPFILPRYKKGIWIKNLTE